MAKWHEGGKKSVACSDVKLDEVNDMQHKNFDGMKVCLKNCL